MDRQAEIRRYLRVADPEVMFVTRRPNPGGLWFTEKPPGFGPMRAVIHVFTIFDRTAHLPDEDFMRALFAIGEVITSVYEITERELVRLDDDVLAEARQALLDNFPEAEAALASAWDIE